MWAPLGRGSARVDSLCLNLYPYVEYQWLEGQGYPRAESTALWLLCQEGRPTCLEQLRQASPPGSPAPRPCGREGASPWPSCPLPSPLCSSRPDHSDGASAPPRLPPTGLDGTQVTSKGGSARSLGRPGSCSPPWRLPAPPRERRCPPSCRPAERVPESCRRRWLLTLTSARSHSKDP